MVLKLHRNVKIIHKEQIVITYKLLAEHKQDPVLGEYKTYGIAVEQEDTVIRVIEYYLDSLQNTEDTRVTSEFTMAF